VLKNSFLFIFLVLLIVPLAKVPFPYCTYLLFFLLKAWRVALGYCISLIINLKLFVMTKFILSLLFIWVVVGCQKSAPVAKTKTGSMSCTAPKMTDVDWYTSGQKAPLFEGLDGIDFTITTGNAEAQRYFNQGMMLSYGFNHAEAARSFYEASRLDPKCAMAFWGYAYVLGPNYNGGMEDDNYERAYKAAQKAQSLSKKCTAKERALITALLQRYALKAPADRGSLDNAYATAMKKVYDTYPTDPDIGALYAESVMDLHPWDLYDKATKAPKAWTPHLLSILERLIQENPKHPGAHHFYIHAMEGSATPEKALASAELLNTLVPGSGHLVHMPSHIYINTGDYHLGTQSNLRAIAIDSSYTTTCHAQGVYPLAYYPHNYHFLTATATLEGNAAIAWKAAKKLQAHTATAIMDEPGWGTLQHYYTIPNYIAVKFEMWDTILAQPAPIKDLVYLKTIWQYARGMAYLGKKNTKNAQDALTQLKALAADPSLQELTVWEINSMADLAQIAAKVVEAGIATQQKQFTPAITLLKEAAAIEDALNYNEPPDWFFSVRHHLGALLLQAQQYAEAEKVYLQDLQVWKKNGWALVGLHQALVRQGKNEEAKKVKTAFDLAWKHSDITITSSSPLFIK
jgi:tetratricopeptide (TPR) repeat protein